MSDHVIAKQVARVKALAAVCRQLEPHAGLAEADRLGLKVCAEILEEAVQRLELEEEFSSPQVEHLKEPSKELFAKADELSHSAAPAQIAKWWRALEPAAQAYARAVHDLPHR